MADWYLMKGGQKQGPVDTAGLKRLAQSGELLPTDMIWRDGLPNWIPASQTKGLEFVASHNSHPGRPSETVTTTVGSGHVPVAQPRSDSRSLIKYRCANCGTALESERRLAGKQDTCPSCGKATLVPLDSTTGTRAFFLKIPKSVCIGGAAVVLAVIVSLAMWLALRDTWERVHGEEIRKISETTISLVRGGNDEEAVAKYQIMAALVGDRQIQAISLREAVSNAKEAADSARGRLKESRQLAALKQEQAENLSKLSALESEAAASIRNGRDEIGIAKYAEALEFAKQTQTGNAEFRKVAQRVSVAMKNAEAQVQAARRQAKEASMARDRILTSAQTKLASYYAGPLEAVIGQLEKLDKAGQASQYEGDAAWYKGYTEAYKTLLTLELKRIKDMPFFAEEERRNLGDIWKDIEVADKALATRLQCAITLHKSALDLLSRAIHGTWSGAEADIGGIIRQVQKEAGVYSLKASMHCKFTANLIGQGLLDLWPTRLKKDGLICDTVRIAAGAETALAAAKKAEDQVAAALKRDSDTPVTVLCPKCAGTGRKSDKEIEAEMSAISAASMGSGRSTRVKIDPQCPECKGNGSFTISKSQYGRELALPQRQAADNVCRAILENGTIKKAVFVSYFSGLKYWRTPPAGLNEICVRYAFTFTTKAGLERTYDWGYIVLQRGDGGWVPTVLNVDGTDDISLR